MLPGGSRDIVDFWFQDVLEVTLKVWILVRGRTPSSKTEIQKLVLEIFIKETDPKLGAFSQ